MKGMGRGGGEQPLRELPARRGRQVGASDEHRAGFRGPYRTNERVPVGSGGGGPVRRGGLRVHHVPRPV